MSVLCASKLSSRAIRQRLGQIEGVDGFLAREAGAGAGQLEDAVIGPRIFSRTRSASTPPSLTFCQVSLGYIRVQIDTEARLFRDSHIAIFDVRLVENQ
jgi:hypothetical protein